MHSEIQIKAKSYKEVSLGAYPDCKCYVIKGDGINFVYIFKDGIKVNHHNIKGMRKLNKFLKGE